MLNRLKEITLFKVKFPLRCKLHYFASLFLCEQTRQLKDDLHDFLDYV